MCNEWIQSSNPLTESIITGFQPISLAFAKDSNLGSWKGIGKNPSQWSSTAIDDSPSSPMWWTAIGATQYFSDEKIPGPRSPFQTDSNTTVLVNKVNLYVFKLPPKGDSYFYPSS